LKIILVEFDLSETDLDENQLRQQLRIKFQNTRIKFAIVDYNSLIEDYEEQKELDRSGGNRV
jgi:hypothetical protein